MNMSIRKLAYTVSIALMLGGISACHDDDDDPITMTPPPPPAPPAPMTRTFDITVTNLTNAQPLSPVTVVNHSDGNLWVIGESASVALETLAEGGDNSEILALSVVTGQIAADAPLGPGASQTLTLELSEDDVANLSIITMLVNTNDAFSGLNKLDISAMAVGEEINRRGLVYDSGTEANSEASGTIPGPADGGSGFDAVRDDVDFVAMHPGVVSGDDGLPGSVLTQAHRFDNPAISITVTRRE